MTWNRMTGPYWPSYWALILCNIVIPQMLWFKRVRQTVWLLWLITVVINIGMWLERFVIVITSLHRDYMPSAWGMYYPTVWDWATYIGTIGMFLFFIFLFVCYLPVISIFEMRELVKEQRDEMEEEHPHLAVVERPVDVDDAESAVTW